MWEPSDEQKRQTNLWEFIAGIEEQDSVRFANYHDFYHWTVREPSRFWEAVWRYCGVLASESYDAVLSEADRMPGARWFSGSRLNFAENLLRRRDDKTALVFWGEDRVRRRLTYAELFEKTARLAKALGSLGVGAGDRVGGWLPNAPETMIAMLASTSLGAVWSSCSPDFGVTGVVDRFGQIEPKVLFAADCYLFKGQQIDCLPKTAQVVEAVPSIERVIVVPYFGGDQGDQRRSWPSRRFLSFSELCENGEVPTLDFEQLPFDHPLYILYSSGTTGKPKCIVHSAGGTLLEHLKEQVLHTDLKSSDRLFYATTCGWMMWNWLASGLATGATLVLYDGSPSIRDMQVLLDLADEEKVTVFGTSAGLISSWKRSGLTPRKTHRLTSVRTILSTGSVLPPESFDYVYERVKRDVCLASISGGTDIIGCFALGCPIVPVYRGELQTRSLGFAVDVFDETGRSLAREKGELVCTAPFPSMPVGFWNDPDGKAFLDTYFRRYPNTWHHGDYVSLTEHHGMVFYGRSDAVLNPGGVRIGTAEVYRQLEGIEAIEGSVVIGQKWQEDTRIVLFVKLREGVTLDSALEHEIRSTIRENASPRHVPKKIVQVADIPITRSGKISELAVRNIVHGIPVTNREALLNPESLEHYSGRTELQS
jgi:acetoacetyl-CoA synthetase